MIRLASSIRLLPIVLFATTSLLALKIIGMASGNGIAVGSLQEASAQPAVMAQQASDKAAIERAFAPVPPREPSGPPAELQRVSGQKSWAQEMFNFPDGGGDVTGSVAAPPAPAPAQPAADAAKASTPALTGMQHPAARTSAGAPPAKPPQPSPVQQQTVSPGERAVLERLQERRQELDARARELEVREGLLKAAEQRIESRLGELKEVESQITVAQQKKEEADVARLKNLVTMYENMKPKEAARIFDRLEMRVLLDVATQINPRKMSDILAMMSSEAAERLTVELATRGSDTKSAATTDLPKIEGRPRS